MPTSRSKACLPNPSNARSPFSSAMIAILVALWNRYKHLYLEYSPVLPIQFGNRNVTLHTSHAICTVLYMIQKLSTRGLSARFFIQTRGHIFKCLSPIYGPNALDRNEVR